MNDLMRGRLLPRVSQVIEKTLNALRQVAARQGGWIDGHDAGNAR